MKRIAVVVFSEGGARAWAEEDGDRPLDWARGPVVVFLCLFVNEIATD